VSFGKKYNKSALISKEYPDFKQENNDDFTRKSVKSVESPDLAVCRFFSNITNLKKFLGRKFHIGRSISLQVHKN
jgi:hypothetical protein